MNKRFNLKFGRILSFALLGIVFCSILVSCKSNKKEDMNVIFLENDPLLYNENGNYETVIKNKGLKEVNKDNVVVTYKTHQRTSDGVKEVIKNAKVNYATLEGENITLGFSNPEDREVTQYEVNINDYEAYAPIEIKYTDYELICDKESILATDTDFSLTFTLKNQTYDHEFKDSIKPEHIKLNDGFKDLEVKDVTNSKENLTIKLSGNLYKEEISNTYLSGIVAVDSEMITNSASDPVCKIKVENNVMSFSPQSFSFKDGVAKIDLLTPEAKKLTKDSFIFNNEKITLDDLKVKDDRATLTLSLKDCPDLASAKKVLHNEEVLVDGKKVSIELVEASLQSVFDYLELTNNEFLLTLKLYANNGTFNEKINKDALSFDGELKDAKVQNFKRVNANVCELIISLPVLNQTEDTFKRTGSITLKAQSLVNVWNELGKEVTHEREYSQRSLGKDLNESDEVFLRKVKHVAGFDLDEVKYLLQFVTDGTTNENHNLNLLALANVHNNSLKDLASFKNDEYILFDKNMMIFNLPQDNPIKFDAMNMINTISMLYQSYMLVNEAVTCTDVSDVKDESEAIALVKRIQGLSSTAAVQQSLLNVQFYLKNLLDRNKLVKITMLQDELYKNTFNFSTESLDNKMEFEAFLADLVTRCMAMLTIFDYHAILGEDYTNFMNELKTDFNPLTETFKKFATNDHQAKELFCYSLDTMVFDYLANDCTEQTLLIYETREYDYIKEDPTLYPRYSHYDITINPVQIEEFIKRIGDRTLGEQLKAARIRTEIIKEGESRKKAYDENGNILYEEYLKGHLLFRKSSSRTYDENLDYFDRHRFPKSIYEKVRFIKLNGKVTTEEKTTYYKRVKQRGPFHDYWRNEVEKEEGKISIGEWDIYQLVATYIKY